MKNVVNNFSENNQLYYGVTNSANAGQDKVAYFGRTASGTYFEDGCTGSGNGAKDKRPVALNSDGCAIYRNQVSSAHVGTALSAL